MFLGASFTLKVIYLVIFSSFFKYIIQNFNSIKLSASISSYDASDDSQFQRHGALLYFCRYLKVFSK